VTNISSVDSRFFVRRKALSENPAKNAANIGKFQVPIRTMILPLLSLTIIISLLTHFAEKIL